MKILTIADIHNRTDWAENIIAKEGSNVDQILFLGDYWDSEGDGVMEAEKTAYFVKKYIDNPQCIMLLGNHDTGKFWPFQYTDCPGNSPEKSKIITSILSKEQIDKFKFHYFIDDILFSHAFLNKFYIQSTNIEDLKKEMASEEIKAHAAVRSKIRHWFFGRGCYYGDQSGGILWARPGEAAAWNNFSNISGHTPSQKPIFWQGNEPKEEIGLFSTLNPFWLLLDTYGTYYGIYNQRDEDFQVKKLTS